MNPHCKLKHLKTNIVLDFNVEIEQKCNKWINVSYDTKFDRDDISKLKERLIELPKQINNEELRQARISLDDTENILSNTYIYIIYNNVKFKKPSYL